MKFDSFMNDSRYSKEILVAIYSRVSTYEQAEEGYSIDEQERLLTDWCKKGVIRFISAIRIEV